MYRQQYKPPVYSNHPADYIMGSARPANLPMSENWPLPIKDVVVNHVTPTRITRWRHNHLLLILVLLAALMLIMALVSGTVLYLHYVPYKKRPSIEENPCESMYCPFGARCLVDVGGMGLCKCEEACSGVFAPVCGSDGVTYSNECQLRAAACAHKTNVMVQQHGSCDVRDPCSQHDCRFGAQCKPSLDGARYECVCAESCADYGMGIRSSRQVCGTDGRDYGNTCELRKTACKEMKPLEIRYMGKCDPCQGVECPNSQVCQLDDNRNAICGCNAICSEDLRPVCGSDGKTYANECTLRVEACKFRKNIRIIYPGECSKGKNPCESIDCGVFEECHINKYGIASCQCQDSCEAVMKPVCGSDGQTYSNDCELQRNACMQKRPVTIVYKGPCGDTGPCHNYVCSFGAICVLKSGRPGCECPTCTENFEPICGTDGMSYSNECKMKREACIQKKEITVSYLGLCNTCSQTECEYFAQCELDRHGRPTCVCSQGCVTIEAKVCGNDGITYKNECELRVAACTKKQYITVVSKGPCDLCVQVHCKYGARCEDGRCVCPTDCPEQYEPVCGTDGATHTNECELRRAACVHARDMAVLFYGECEDIGGSGAGGNLLAPPKSDELGSGSSACEDEPCRFGGLCDYDSEGIPQCVCPFECPPIREPVCGSDGQFYDSECKMKEQACKSQKKIAIVPKNRCQKRIEVACDGEKALINPVTGKDYFCGEGLDSKKCPPSSYCHKTAEFAKCCKEVMVIKSCADTIHGCCPDGKSSAQGPEQAGCPSQCNCNRLGSFSLTCDPSSGQCPCKPGVGGLRCDRCEPGYWGLHKISDGNSGCSPCDCDHYGSVRDDCEQMTGRCVCRHGIQGMKCDICPIGTVLGPDGCMDASIAKAVSGSCEQLQCYHGAKCKEKESQAQCICDFKCTAEDRGNEPPEDQTVCGSDGNSYGSECQLKQFSCRYQKPIAVIEKGTCSKMNVTQTGLQYPSSTVATTLTTRLFVEMTQFVTESKIAREVTEDPLLYLRRTTPRYGVDYTTPTPFHSISMPLFSGHSYLELAKLEAGSRLSLELELRTLANEGIVLYNGQMTSGRGDFVSISIHEGHVEFRYDLGSGFVVLRSKNTLKLGKFHRIVANRYQRDGQLTIDGHDTVSGETTEPKSSLDLGQNLYIGFLPGHVDRIYENIGVSTGFIGCIRHFKIGRQFIDLRYPGPKVLKAENINECSDDSCSSMPCLNGASCIITDGQDYACICPNSFTGRHCEIQLDPCASQPCAYGATCLSLQENRFSCLCPPGSSGESCEIESGTGDESGIVLDFGRDSFLEYPSLASATPSLSVEIWFLTRSSNGLLLYNGQKPDGVGDFLALTLLNGFLHFTYNLGSGTASIPYLELLRSQEPVTLGVWHSVKISRMRKRGMLQLDDKPIISGESTGHLSELNLGQPLYIGGVPEFPPLKYTLVVQEGLDGAIQRIVVNDEVWEDMQNLATHQRNIQEYIGPPCMPGTCGLKGKCIPMLDEYKCLCEDGYTGRWCNATEETMEMNDNFIHPPVKFDGKLFMQFSEGAKGMKLRKSKDNHIQLTFKTRRGDGLLLWLGRGSAFKGDHLAIVLVRGHVELSFNLGRERSLLKCRGRVDDDRWHTVVVKRNKRLAHLVVDDSSALSVTSEPGATELNTDGILWIGGCSSLPSDVPDVYHQGFRGCVSSVTFDGEPLSLSNSYAKYCTS